MGRMNAVGSPVFRFGSGIDRFVETLLEGNPDRSRVCRDIFGEGATRFDFRKPGIIHSPATQHERFADHEGDIGKGRFRAFQQGGEAVPVDLGRAVVFPVQLVPDVVDADEYAQDVRFQIECILISPCIEIGDFVSGNAAIVDL